MTKIALSDSDTRMRLVPTIEAAPGVTPQAGLHFVQWSRAWYRANVPLEGGAVDDVNFGDADYGDLRMTWYPLDDDVSPRLEVFDDGWTALTRLPGVLEILERYAGESMTPETFCRELTLLGFVDKTVTAEMKAEEVS
jgi:hypothetical protein